MNNARTLVGLALAAGVLLLVVAGVYFAEEAKALPSFFPGHASSGSEATTHHIKHGIAAVVVALGAFVFAWFQSGPKTRTA